MSEVIFINNSQISQLKMDERMNGESAYIHEDAVRKLLADQKEQLKNLKKFNK